MDALIQDLKQKLIDIGSFNWVAIWNGQINKMHDAKAFAIQNPSAYIQIETNDFKQLGESYQGVDLHIDIHIISEELDAGDGDIDSQISVFKLRDDVVKTFSLYKTNMGGFMVKINETQDYNHTNLYHYIIQYVIHYIDDTAKPHNIFTIPPTKVIINKNIN
jgi:hypothetical protein